MSDTPRTDDAILTKPFQVRTLGFEVVSVSFAEQLERELNAAKSALSGRTVSCSNCNTLAVENAEMKKAIKNAQSAISAFLGFHSDDLSNAQVASLSETLSKLQPYLK